MQAAVDAQQQEESCGQTFLVIGQTLGPQDFDAEQQPVAPTVANATEAITMRMDFIEFPSYHIFLFAQGVGNASLQSAFAPGTPWTTAASPHPL